MTNAVSKSVPVALYTDPLFVATLWTKQGRKWSRVHEYPAVGRIPGYNTREYPWVCFPPKVASMILVGVHLYNINTNKHRLNLLFLDT